MDVEDKKTGQDDGMAYAPIRRFASSATPEGKPSPVEPGSTIDGGGMAAGL